MLQLVTWEGTFLEMVTKTKQNPSICSQKVNSFKGI